MLIKQKIKFKKTIHELAKDNPSKTYNELEQERAEQDTYDKNNKENKKIN